jgi:hypothetical protein
MIILANPRRSMPHVETSGALMLSIVLTLPRAWVLGWSFFSGFPREIEDIERRPTLSALERWAYGTHALWSLLRLVGLVLLCAALAVLFYKSLLGIGRLFP